MTQPLISAPEFEHHPDGFGVGHSHPRISWKFSHPRGVVINDWVQSAYDIDIQVDNSASSEITHVESPDSVLVPWPAADLLSRSVAAVRVRAYDQDGIVTQWSPCSTVEAALLRREDWTATPITSAERILTEKGGLRPIRFRKQFAAATEGEVVKARLYITAFGVYEAYLNGMRVGDHILAPGWTSYHHRLNYQTFDVTTQPWTAENVLAIEVAEGWYAGRLRWEGGKRFHYGDDLGILAQLEITYNTGDVVFVKSDDTWRSLPSATMSSEFYDGEIYDQREEITDWNTSDYDVSSCMGTKSLPFPSAKLIAPDAPPVRITQKVESIDIITSPAGKTIVDFGQNLVGIVQIRSLQASAGHQVSLVHVEVLEDGEISTHPLRDVECTDTIICSSTSLHC
jgi:alpha-L-rhamnosidase